VTVPEGTVAAYPLPCGGWSRADHSDEQQLLGPVVQSAVCVQQQLLVEATGIKPVMVPEHSSRYSRENVGSEYIGWLHFQPIYEQLVQTNPDMFH